MSYSIPYRILFVFVILIFAIMPQQNSDNTQPLDFVGHSDYVPNSPYNPIQGNSYLNITSSISQNSQFNASWYAEVSILESYGSDLLPNQSTGLRNQIDQYIGNDDGTLNSSEVLQFTQIITNSRNWSNAESAGCCIFDHTPLISAMGNQVSVTPPQVGDVNMTNGSWGWSETAEMYGLVDNRVTRIIDLPRVGALIEEIPLHINLPEGWEFRYSAMSAIIGGEPGNFIVNRSEAPVASNIRISIGENFPPQVSASRFPYSSSTISLNDSSTYSGVCNDGFLETPVMEWNVSKDNELLYSIPNAWFQFTPSDYDFIHGEVASISFRCTDSHGLSSSWFENIIVDGISPEWSGDIFVEIDGNSQQLNIEDTTLPIISGGEIKLNITAIDESNLPVSIELFSNISEGWRQYQINEGIFSFSVFQGEGVNGLHLNITDRHLSKESTYFSLLLLITDDAGNEALKEWIIKMLDGNPPTILMDIMANDSLVELDNSAREGDTLKLVFSNSYDDLDSIDNTTWQVSLDGNIILESSPWSSEVEKLNIPELGIGIHEVIIVATDSSGNSRTEAYPLTIFPKSGADLEVISQSLMGDLFEGGNAIYILEMKNNGYDDTFARVCIENLCSRFVNFPGADIGTTTISILEYEFIMPQTSTLNISVEWDSNSADQSGDFMLEYPVDTPNANNDINYLISVILFIAILFFISRNVGMIDKNK